jgi:hypothetical protein
MALGVARITRNGDERRDRPADHAQREQPVTHGQSTADRAQNANNQQYIPGQSSGNPDQIGRLGRRRQPSKHRQRARRQPAKELH